MSVSTSPIPILSSIPACRAWRQSASDQKETVGFVPTMGALHDGHLSLVRRSLQDNDLTVVSIFVNPAQFAPHEDLGAYPRTLPHDLEQLARQQVTVSGNVRTPSAVFLPSVQDMYPSGIQQDVALQKGAFVEVNGYSHQMEGASRPHFFRGVATVVAKLFNVVQPTNAYFGQKDIQQALLLRRMCRDLLLAHPDAGHLHVVPTVRDPVDGLALSSRNVYLSVKERAIANTLYRALQVAESGWLAGEAKDACVRAAEVLVTNAVKAAALRGVEMRLDYIEMNDPDSFEVLDDQSQSIGGEPVVVSGAVWVGKTRLIDNIVVENEAEYWDVALTAAGAAVDGAPIDVVVPARAAQDHAFASLKTAHSTAQFTLTELCDHVSRLAIPDVQFKAIPIQRDADDTWCIDPRGVLTLCVSKSLYQQLGLVGTKLLFKGCLEQYVIRIPVKRETTSVAAQARQRAALEVWDRVRVSQGLGRWRVAYVGPLASAHGPSPEACVATDVTARVRCDADVYVPRVGDLAQSTDETAEDYQERFEALFEWVGMACLGAQRLRANDRVDPYVSVYDAPSPASINNVKHLRWRGLMDGNFVQSVIDTAVSILSTSPTEGDDSAFLSVTLHSNPVAPVGYMPESPAKEAPLRVPGPEAGDTVCLVLSKSSGRLTWAIAQSIGKWDARWG